MGGRLNVGLACERVSVTRVGVVSGVISRVSVRSDCATCALHAGKACASIGEGLCKGLRHIGFVAKSDAAWATRVDGSSQGGYLIFSGQ